MRKVRGSFCSAAAQSEPGAKKVMGAYLQSGEFMQMGIFGLGTGMVSLGRELVAGVTPALYLPVRVVVGPKFIFYSAFRRISPPLLLGSTLRP